MDYLVKKAIITASGYNARWLPVAKVIPKFMLPVGMKPAIQHLVEECVEAKIEEIIIVTRKKNSLMEQYFQNDPKLETVLRKKRYHYALAHLKKIKDLKKKAKLRFVQQDPPRGFWEAIKICRRYLKAKEPVGILHGDLIIKRRNPRYSAIEAIMRIYQKEKKPVFSAGGRMVLTNDLLADLEKVNFNIHNGLRQMAFITRRWHKEGKVFNYPYTLGKIYDVGDELSYLQSLTAYALRQRPAK